MCVSVSAFSTPSFATMAALVYCGWAELDRQVSIGGISSDVAVEQKVEILTALRQLGEQVWHSIAWYTFAWDARWERAERSREVERGRERSRERERQRETERERDRDRERHRGTHTHTHTHTHDVRNALFVTNCRSHQRKFSS